MSQNNQNNQTKQNQSNQLTTLEKLQKLQEQRKDNKATKTRFDGIVVVNVGVEPTEHFPKLKDANGNKIKDEDGNDKRAEQSDGLTYTFVEFGTAKIVKVVLDKRYKLELLQPYQVSGYGYDITNARMVFIDTDGELSTY